MRLLITGSDKIYAIENYYAKYLLELGVDVLHFPSQSIFYDYYLFSPFNKIFFRFGISRIYISINNQLKAIVIEFKPKIVWIFKGMEIYPSTIRWLKERGVLVVNFNGDNPFIFSGRGSGNYNVTRSIKLYHLHFTYNLLVKKELEKRKVGATFYLPFGFEIPLKLYEECATVQEVNKVCFVGNPDKQRAAFILKLAKTGIHIDIYGHSWPRFLNHKNISIMEPVYGDELWKVLRKYRVQLNLMRIHNETGHNMRSFEVPGIGGIMLAPDTVEHRVFFEEKKEIFLFKEIDDCADWCNKILNLQPKEATQIRTAARSRSVYSGYSYQDRAKDAKEILTTLDCLR